MDVRYKIYIEGVAWSVSEKYILACNSLTLLVKPRYYDFFTRSLMPLQHYWPVRRNDKCSSIKFAVDWGNSHKQKVPFEHLHSRIPSIHTLRKICKLNHS